MKKLILLIGILVISNFEIDVHPRNESRAQNLIQKKLQQVSSKSLQNIPFEDKIISRKGIQYRVFYYNGDIEVINETKEKLKIQKLKLEIQKLKDY